MEINTKYTTIRRRALSMGLCAALTLSALCGCASQPGTAGMPDDVRKLSNLPDPDQGGTLSDGGTGQGDSLPPEASAQDGGVRNPDNAGPADVSTVTAFAVRLFQESLSSEQDKGAAKNVLISPVSVLFALSMTANGANGNTLAQMEDVLGASVSALNTYLHEYRTCLPRGEGYKLSIANSIWFKDDPDFTVNEEFLALNAAWYNADIYQAPFDNSTLKAINKWVSDSTDQMIPDILDHINNEAVMFLINGLAFDAEWRSIYQKSQVREADFTEENGTRRRTELMYAKENVYLQDAYAQGFLKYYKDGKYAFAALLPNEGVTVSDYVKTLDGPGLQEMLSNPVHVPVRTAIPKFEAEYDISMNDIFKSMGMADAFDRNLADFSYLGSSTDENIYISRILHKTYIAVDERGTRAGAATAVAMDTTSAYMPQEEKTVYLDRPFVYLIIDCEENVPVFIGTLMSVK